jgi:hypothetical protein
LGELYFPHSYGESNPFTRNFRINLKDFFNLATEWRDDQPGIPSGEIAAIVAYGPAVQYPDYNELEKSVRKYWLAGPKVKKTVRVPIDPLDADFLEITWHDSGRAVSKPAFIQSYSDQAPGGSGDSALVYGGIRILSKGIEQIKEDLQKDNPAIISALKQGVPVLYGNSRFSFQNTLGILSENPRKINWNKDGEGNLIGKIE